jgi:hypothetical protein
MTVAPHDACVSCFKGDTTTAFGLRGDAEWIMVGIHKQAALGLQEAKAMFLLVAEQELGCDPGKVPGGELTHVVLLCEDCARRIGTKVGELDDGEVPCYGQPDRPH